MRLGFTGRATLERAKSGDSSLTLREREVLALMARGKTAREIAEILHIATRTINVHAQAAARKLGARNRLHAIAIALRDGIVEV